MKTYEDYTSKMLEAHIRKQRCKASKAKNDWMKAEKKINDMEIALLIRRNPTCMNFE